jgi:GLPGLI family protein
MKTLFIFAAALLLLANTAGAQTFVHKAVIEYEVKSNIKKTMGNDSWAEMIKDNIPTFKTAYYTFTFDDNKSIYKFDHWDEKVKVPEFLRRGDEDNSWYADYAAGRMTIQKNVIGSMFNIEDSMPNLEWRITTESRNIAGFNCRKAVTKIFDSVYVFAFYTDEITVSGGPGAINGLPGMILGVTIPRLFTSWIATKVSVNNVNTASIKPVTAKKYYTNAALKSTIIDRTKDWYSDGDAAEQEEQKQQRNRFIWTLLL